METLRTVIVGGPGTGKSSLAESLSPAALHTDDLIDLGWSEASAAAAVWFDAPGPWVVEGVATARALRKWLKAHPEGKPCDRIVFLLTPIAEHTKGQRSMAKGVRTVWNEIADEIADRGVAVEFGNEGLRA